MTYEELITLGNMGFSAQQVGQLIAFRQMQPAPAQQPKMQQPAQISPPAMPPIQPAQPQFLQQPAQIPQAQAAPQVQPWQPYGQQLFQQAAPGSAIFQPQAQPQAQPPLDPVTQIMQAIGGVQTSIQAQALAMTQQPKPQTADDIMASIINPPMPAQPGQVQK
jgi:hypothetical protein